MISTRRLHKEMLARFKKQELKKISLAVGADWNELDGRLTANKVHDLLHHVQAQAKWPQLLLALREVRPNDVWPEADELAAGLAYSGYGDPQWRNRLNILDCVHAAWIEGVLRPTLYEEGKRPLTLTYRPYDSAVAQPTLPATLGDIFTSSGGSLLLLGEPGSGKTISLLQLAEALIASAKNDATQPLPVVLNMASWAVERLALADWIAEELLLQYQTPRQVSQKWLADNQLTLLLDGLDEVKAEVRAACVAVMNDFMARHKPAMVVCSRLAEYEQLPAGLNVETAVCLQPLTIDQANKQLEGVALPATETADSPLQLQVSTHTVEEDAGLTMQSPVSSADVQQLWQRASSATYEQAQAFRWLHNLAAQLQSQDQSIFYLERLHPGWLDSQQAYRWRSKLLMGVMSALLLGLLSTVIFGLIDGIVYGSSYGPTYGLIFGLICGFILGAVYQTDAVPRLTEEISWRRPSPALLGKAVKRGRDSGLIFGVLSGISIGLTEGFTVGLLVAATMTLIGGIIGGLDAFTPPSGPRLTDPNEGVWVPWHNARLMGLLGMLVGLIAVALNVEIIGGVEMERLAGVIFGLIYGLLLGAGVGLVLGLLGGLWHYGGKRIAEHYLLRWLLARQGVLPFPFQDGRLIAFLDEMVARGLLRRVGNGWMFADRALLHYFAEYREGK